jgi:hypothetical protein
MSMLSVKLEVPFFSEIIVPCNELYRATFQNTVFFNGVFTISLKRIQENIVFV